MKVLTFFYHIWNGTCTLPMLASDQLVEKIDILFTEITARLNDEVPIQNFDNCVAEALHSFFFSLHPGLDIDETQDPVRVYMICSHLKSDGGFESLPMIANTCSYLRYIMKVLGLREVLRLRDANPGEDATLVYVLDLYLLFYYH